jgi:hypothetical protein
MHSGIIKKATLILQKPNPEMNKKWTYFFIGRILSLDFEPLNRDGIRHDLIQLDINWPGFVKMGSDNFILPAIYLNLTRHNLHSFLPADLNGYLGEVLNLNRERNMNIVRQMHFVNNLLIRNNISSLFMKGTGNIVDGLYQDIGERMVYDIDVLVPDDKMITAAKLLESEGFITRKDFIPRSLDSTMHYPILLREDFVAGVEIHRSPSQYLYQKNFEPERVLRNQMDSSVEKGFKVMGYQDRIIHNFLHAQLMHNGHYHADVSHRDLYDLLLLSKKENPWHTFTYYKHYKSQSLAYLKLVHKTFGLPMPETLNTIRTGNFFLWRHKQVLQLSSKGLKRHHLALLLLQKYLLLPIRSLWNAKARNYIISRLTNQQWYKVHFDSMKRRMKI